MPEDKTPEKGQLRVFLCHAHEDKPAVLGLYKKLRDAGATPWLDEEDLLPGLDWEQEIRRAVRASDVVIVCLSRRAVTKEGFVQKEILLALDVADEKPEGTIFIIPVKLEQCEAPDRLRRWQWVDLRKEDGFKDLMRSLRTRAEKLGLTVKRPRKRRSEPEIVIHPVDGTELIRIPAGKFTMGNDHYDQRPRRRVYLDEYYIAKNPVTNAQYRRFVKTTGHPKPTYWGDKRFNKPNQPVVGVSWDDAQAYCKWVGLRLPTEAEWEKAARGTRCREYPWGNRLPDKALCNCDANMDSTTEVVSYPKGASPYGCLDMAGNVWEWCEDWYGPYDERALENPTGPSNGQYRVLRGGSWFNDADDCRCAYRSYAAPEGRGLSVGFRVARPLP